MSEEGGKGRGPRGCYPPSYVSMKVGGVASRGSVNAWKRKEEILIKVEEDRDWIETHRR